MANSVITGGCHCGAVRYSISGEPRRHSICLCGDCRRNAGAYMVGWMAVSDKALVIRGTLASYNSSGDVRRDFCPKCGTGLFYRSPSLFPGEIDVRSGTFDRPEMTPPAAIVQAACAPAWFWEQDRLEVHARYPD